MCACVRGRSLRAVSSLHLGVSQWTHLLFTSCATACALRGQAICVCPCRTHLLSTSCRCCSAITRLLILLRSMESKKASSCRHLPTSSLLFTSRRPVAKASSMGAAVQAVQIHVTSMGAAVQAVQTHCTQAWALQYRWHRRCVCRQHDATYTPPALPCWSLLKTSTHCIHKDVRIIHATCHVCANA